MMGWTGWGAAGAFAMMVGMLLLAALAVAGVALLFRPVFGNRSQKYEQAEAGRRRDAQQAGGHDSPLAIIEERYARGEIGREEFLALRRSLFESD